MPNRWPEGNALVYCQGAFSTPNGKTAHGLVRFTRRYRILAVIDRSCAGHDAGQFLDGKPSGIPILADVRQALRRAWEFRPTHLVIGLAPDGGRLPASARREIRDALRAGLHLDSGLHDFLSQDPEFASLARRHRVRIRDVRMPPPRSELHFFSGDIEKVGALRIAMLGTDSAVGKRTTAWRLADDLNHRGVVTEMIGTGQTAWLQGARYGIILDSLVNDFVSGELEHAVVRAWRERHPRVMLIEGQGSLMNPAYPGGFEILAATRPHLVIMQHAPSRRDYDGFPGYRLHSLVRQIAAVEMLSQKPVIAVTVNHEGMTPRQTRSACRSIQRQTGLPAVDVLFDGPGKITEIIVRRLRTFSRRS